MVDPLEDVKPPRTVDPLEDAERDESLLSPAPQVIAVVVPPRTVDSLENVERDESLLSLVSPRT